jgi:four helix bundle protein
VRDDTLRRMPALESLDAWRIAKVVARRTYLLTVDERLRHHHAFIDQVRKAALSIPANICEG